MVLSYSNVFVCVTSVIIITIAIIYQVTASNSTSEINSCLHNIKKEILSEYFEQAFEKKLTQNVKFQYTDTYFKVEVARINKPSIYFEVFGKIPDEQGIGPLTRINGDGLFDKEIMDGIYNLYKFWQTYNTPEATTENNIEINMNK